MEQSPSIYDNIKGQNRWNNNGLIGDIRTHKDSKIDYAKARVALAEAAAQLQPLQRLRKRSGR